MISEKEILSIGKLNKPHGINGEISAIFDLDIDPAKLRCIVLNIDGIYVPFFISGTRARSKEAYLLAIDGINSEDEAAELSNYEIFGLADDPEISQHLTGSDDNDDQVYLEDLIGYTILDGTNNLGVITDFDDSTENMLFIVEPPTGNGNIYIPITDDFIIEIDDKKQQIIMDLPEGLAYL